MSKLSTTFGLRYFYYDYDNGVYPAPVLYIYLSPEEAAQKEEGINIVEGDLWFFAADGSPLEPSFTQQPYVDNVKNKYSAGVYSLKPGAGKKLQDIIADMIAKNPATQVYVNEANGKPPQSALQFLPQDIKSRIQEFKNE